MKKLIVLIALLAMVFSFGSAYGATTYDASGQWEAVVQQQTPYLKLIGYRTINAMTLDALVLQDDGIFMGCDDFSFVTEPFSIYVAPMNISASFTAGTGTVEADVYTMSVGPAQSSHTADAMLASWCITFMTSGGPAWLTMYDFTAIGAKGSDKATGFSTAMKLDLWTQGPSGDIEILGSIKADQGLTGDYNGDGSVNGDDVAPIFSNWGASGLICP